MNLDKWHLSSDADRDAWIQSLEDRLAIGIMITSVHDNILPFFDLMEAIETEPMMLQDISSRRASIEDLLNRLAIQMAAL